jgi:CHAT domain-containing protein
VQLADGRFTDARRSLERALSLAEGEEDAERVARIRASLGNAFVGTGDLTAADDELTRGLGVAIESDDAAASAAMLNNLGNRNAATHDYEGALWAYERAAKLAEQLGRPESEARARAGAARVAIEAGLFDAARAHLRRVRSLVGEIPSGHARASLNIHLGRSQAMLSRATTQDRADAVLGAYAAFSMAADDATALGDDRLLALAHLNLGDLYRDEQHRSEALYLTRLARREAERADAPEILYRAHWQEGRILWSEYRVADALAAHRRAVAVLEETKPIASAGYAAGEADFRRTVGGVYTDTVDLLLRTADLAGDPRTEALLVREARDTLEKLKGAELRDYFEDECIAEVRGAGRRLDRLGPRAAVVYTITLPERLELLVGLDGRIERFTTPVSARELVGTVDRFRASVQNPLSSEYRVLGERLHAWLVAPYAERLAQAGVDTIVFVPDGRLRTLPFGALNDGEQYVVDRYATAVALSLHLLAAPELGSEPGRPILAGVSEGVQGFSPLEAVDRELAAIRELEGGELLLNRSFTLDGVRAAVASEIPGVVHLATHAVFTGNPETSFLLTYGGRVGFDDLSDVVGMTRVGGAPLDLLVLSACETAAGNDRAGLGFAGSAIRAGARTALGSLWPIVDEAAQAVMVDFYAGMQTNGLSKAESLRRAQSKLRHESRFDHPYYWAPFTLVNDWL